MAKMTPKRARVLLSKMALTPSDVAEVLRHVLAQAAEQGAEAAPAPARHERISDADSGALVDRSALNAYLDKLGYRRAGDVVYLTPARTRTGEMSPSNTCAVVVISTESRDGNAFHVQGVRLDRFRKNPIVLYNHDYDGLPVARSLWERVRDGANGPELIIKPQFHRDTELSREVCRLVMHGGLSAWELGVVPENWEKRGDGYFITTWDVLEFSVVPRPEDMAQLREERRRRRISSPALVRSIMEEGEVDVV